ncbi:DUF6297 family protein [Lentzea albida]|uniref:DUF6297 family protein n=1 Tax=Lentzea albida TaxID=65499 RepID=UPI000B7E215B|nr:DUF6297 family protein [Lentzea albida]
MTAWAVRRRLRTPVPWRLLVARLYSRLVVFGIVALVAYGWAYAGLTKAPAAGSAWSALWLSVLGAAVLMKAALAFGPVFAGADRMFWVLSSPVRRGALLRPRFFGLLVVAAGLGVAWTAAVFGLVGAVVPALEAVGIGAAVGVAVVAFAVVVQRGRWRPQGWLSGVVGLAVVALLVPLELGVEPGATGALPVAAWVLAIGLAVAAGVSLSRLRRSDLAAGGSLAGVAKVSVSWFDLALLGAILAERRARALGRVKSARLGVGGRGARSAPPSRLSRVAALAWTDALRLRRTPNAALVWAALLPAPALVALGGEPEFAAAVQVIAAFLATDRLAAGLRFVCRSPAVRRVLGLPDRTLRRAHLVVPAAGAVLWCAVTTAFTPHVSVLNGLVSAVGAVAVVYRIATRPPVDHGAAIVDFGLFGPTPLGLIVQLSRGPALLTVLALVQTAL